MAISIKTPDVIKEMSYEDAMKELENVLGELEDEEHKLDDSLKLFKYGMTLYEYCDSILTKTEGEIKILLDKSKNLEADFMGEED